MDSQKKLGIEKESTPVDRGRYQRLVGRLFYLSHTRPDIGFAVSAVSQFMHSPTEEHMEAVYRILRYLKMTPRKGLFFRKTENRDTEVYSERLKKLNRVLFLSLHPLFFIFFFINFSISKQKKNIRFIIYNWIFFFQLKFPIRMKNEIPSLMSITKYFVCSNTY